MEITPKLFLVGLLVLTIVTSCITQVSEEDSVIQPIDMIIPLAEGNYWVYDGDINFFNGYSETFFDTLALGEEFIKDGNRAWEFSKYHESEHFPFRETLFAWYDDISIDSAGIYYNCYINRGGCAKRVEFKFPESESDTVSFNYIGFPEDCTHTRTRKVFITDPLKDYPNRTIYKAVTKHSYDRETIFIIASGIGIVEWQYKNGSKTHVHKLKSYFISN
jgi:hypothetical protein